MLLNEIINEVGMTKRAVKYYEEKGLLSVDKDNNGYRNYTAQDVETLKKISVYRKLGISIKDIQSLLETGDKSILLRIYQEKVQEKVLKDSELEALKQFIDDGDADKQMRHLIIKPLKMQLSLCYREKNGEIILKVISNHFLM